MLGGECAARKAEVVGFGSDVVDTENTRRLEDERSPLGVAGNFGTDAVQLIDGGIQVCLAGHGHGDENSRPVAREVHCLTELTVCNGEKVSVERAHFGDTEGDLFHAPLDPPDGNQRPDVDDVAHSELSFGDDEDPGENIAHDLLCAEAETCTDDRHHRHHRTGGKVEEQQHPDEGDGGNGEVEAPACSADERSLVGTDRIVPERIDLGAQALDATCLVARDVADHTREEKSTGGDGDDEESLVFDPIPRARGAFGGGEQKHLRASITTCQDELVRIVLGTCHHDCPDSCGWEVTVDDGIATKMRGNASHPFSQGELCPKVNHFLERVYSPERVTTPLVRVGAKGSGTFRRATWDEAMASIVAAVHERISRFGGETVMPWSSAGNQGLLQMSSLDRRFFAALGASTTHGALCGSVAKTGHAATTGTGMSSDPTTVEHSRYVILWGTNTRLTNRHLWPFIERARANGAKLVVIDPVRTVTADAADWFIQPRPGTDTALALAMLNVIIAEGLVDGEFVDDHVSGYADLVRAAGEWSPARAAEECGVDAGDIVVLAREYASTTPAFIRTLIGAEHRANGGMIFRALACLPTVTGQWRHLGGGLSRSVGSWFGDYVDDSVFDPADVRKVRSLPFTQLGRVLTEVQTPPVTALFVWNGNPVITCPNAAVTRRGLVRDDLFTVVSEQFLTDTAKYADVVLPATTQIEHVDVVPAWGHLNLGWNGKAIEPVGESVSNTELFRRLAVAFGIIDPLFAKTDDELVDIALRSVDPTALRRDGFVRLPNADLRLFADGKFGHADGRCDVSGIVYEPVQRDDRYPLVMLTPKQHARFLNSSYSHLPAHGPREGGPFLEMTTTDASDRGLVDGDVARVTNDRGELTVPVRVSDRLGRGVVAVPFGWWDADHNGAASANDLTSDAPTDMGGGVAYHDTFVEVSRA